jgi:Flp pilus assembly protein TadG
MVVVLLPVIAGFAALTVDVGMLYRTRAELQNAADGAALAGADAILRTSDVYTALSATTAIAQANVGYVSKGKGKGKTASVGTSEILKESDVIFGQWDIRAELFIPGAVPSNAVHVTTKRSSENGNPLSLFFAGIFGKYETDISASATAFAPAVPPGFATRFLIDNEMFDTDVPAIEDLADSLGTSPDKLLEDKDGDGFIDFPPGVIELPTGQVGDEGMFMVGDGFPFTGDSDPSLMDFLLFQEGKNEYGIPKSMLDPLMGVEPVSNASMYPDFVQPNSVLVSAIWKSDVNDNNPGVKALGERRGLVAFKIIGVGKDPDGKGSQLPNLILEIVDPSFIDLNQGSTSLVSAQGVLQIVE